MSDKKQVVVRLVSVLQLGQVTAFHSSLQVNELGERTQDLFSVQWAKEVTSGETADKWFTEAALENMGTSAECEAT